MPTNWIDDIANKTLAGISKAQKDYETWTSGYWLCDAPEYMVTTYIARQISTINRTFYLTLENNVGGGIKDARRRPGKVTLREDLRPDGKFDILLWWAYDKPSAIIEVKKKVFYFSNIKDDVDRICGTLKIPNTSIRCGFIAYYMSLPDGKRELARNRVQTRVDRVKEKVKAAVIKENLKLKQYPVKVVEDDGYAWVAVVLKISR